MRFFKPNLVNLASLLLAGWLAMLSPMAVAAGPWGTWQDRIVDNQIGTRLTFERTGCSVQRLLAVKVYMRQGRVFRVQARGTTRIPTRVSIAIDQDMCRMIGSITYLGVCHSTEIFCLP